uniref:Serine/threonine-protein phosphatase 2A 55 kDa regulatory subunit B n=1 Tax=Spongospora subterranea TaxID=70186 RepID=A0A0H5QHY5_9EUKA|eukprot:CRZ01588.1 hypothetical protein [Spongospora subterranea]
MSSNTHELSAQWSFSQTIGDDNGDQDKEQDYISAVAFSPNGAYVAVGNRSGKIWIHQERQDKQIGVKRHYEHYTYFQSHKHDIDYLKSQYIAEKINMIRWCPNVHKSQMLLSTNDKTIKLWKMFTHFMHNSTNLHSGFISDISQVRIPQLTDVDSVPACSLKCSFANAHIYHINSISLCTDHETFISSDDLRINMWNLTVPNISFNMVDLRPDNMDDLTEVITSAQYVQHISSLI